MSSSLISQSVDLRQTPMWAAYMRQIGWQTQQFDNVYIFLNHLKLIHMTFGKIQHCANNIPLHKIDQYALDHQISTLVIEPHLHQYSVDQYLQQGFRRSRMKFAPSATILINLDQSEKALLSSFSENARRNIKAAQKHNLTIKHIYYTDPDKDTQFETYFKLMQQVGHMKKFYIPSFTEMRKKYDAFGTQQFLSFAYLPNQNTPIAAVWYGYYQNTLAYMHTGITPEGYEVAANYLLVWEGLREGQKHNLKIFDFEAIYDERYHSDLKQWRGFSQFKKRFHGEVVYYPQPLIKNYSLASKVMFGWMSFFT